MAWRLSSRPDYAGILALAAVAPSLRNFGTNKSAAKSYKASRSYRPHQGKRECARRVRQLEAAAVKAAIKPWLDRLRRTVA